MGSEGVLFSYFYDFFLLVNRIVLAADKKKNAQDTSLVVLVRTCSTKKKIAQDTYKYKEESLSWHP